MIRPAMIRILVGREFRRLLRNPSALMLLGLLSAVALLMATSRPVSPGDDPADGNQHAATTVDVWLIYPERSAWLDHLEANLPASPTIRLIHRDRVPFGNGDWKLPKHDAFVEVIYGEKLTADSSVVPKKIMLNGRYPGHRSDALDPFWHWFWPTLAEYHAPGLRFEQTTQPLESRTDDTASSLKDASIAELVTNELIATILLLIVMFFACCHLLVSFTAQDRERGSLAALVLSPASTSEILLARFTFHLLISLFGCAAIVAILKPLALTQPVLWMVILLASLGLMCVGTCIATLARTQASAALLALCYMLGGTVVFYLSTKFTAFALIRQLAFESYTFPILFATMNRPVSIFQATGLIPMLLLVLIWLGIARSCFNRFGWR